MAMASFAFFSICGESLAKESVFFQSGKAYFENNEFLGSNEIPDGCADSSIGSVWITSVKPTLGTKLTKGTYVTFSGKFSFHFNKIFSGRIDILLFPYPTYDSTPVIFVQSINVSGSSGSSISFQGKVLIQRESSDPIKKLDSFELWAVLFPDGYDCSAIVNIYGSYPVVADKVKLTVKTNSVSIGTITGPDINCGSDCLASYSGGKKVLLTATPKANWLFDYWDVDGSCYANSQITVEMDGNKNVLAKFKPKSNVFSLKPVNNTLLGSKTPLVLIHGNGMEKQTQYGWNKFIKIADDDAEFSSKYKLYLFRCDSDKTNQEAGLALGVLMDKIPSLLNKPIVILAHSRGGLDSRYYMNYYKIIEGSFSGKKGGEKVKYLLTLATPHHGSPGADRWWVDFSINHTFKSDPILASKLGWVYFEHTWNSNYKYLLWNDSSKEVTDNLVKWDSAYFDEEMEKKFESAGVREIYKLNENEKYFNKIVAFGGNNTNLKIGPWELLNAATFLTSPHSRLDMGSLLMACMHIVPNGYDSIPIDNDYFPFIANDGLVPLDSATCVGRGEKSVFSLDIDGKVIYDKQELVNRILVKKIIIMGGLTDHLHFIDSDRVVKRAIQELLSF